MSIEERVARGAAWLDETLPGWERRIDLAQLNLANACRCVLGQISGDYWSAPWPRTEMDNRHYGFVCGAPPEDQTISEAYSELDEAWISLIKERFASGTLSDEVSS